jgi:hypothetical protein
VRECGFEFVGGCERECKRVCGVRVRVFVFACECECGFAGECGRVGVWACVRVVDSYLQKKSIESFTCR